MKHNKFLQLISTLSKKEIKSFDKYLKGLYSDRIQVIELFNSIYQHLYTDEIKPETLFEELTNNESYSTKQLSRILAALNCILEEFLRWQKINNKAINFGKNKLMLEVLKERNLDTRFFKTLETGLEKIQASPQDMWTPLHLLQLHHLAFFTIKTDKNTLKKNDLIAALQRLDQFFLAAKLKYSSELQNRINIYAAQEKDNWLLAYLMETQKEKLVANEFTAIYTLVIQLLSEKKDLHYKALKTKYLEVLETVHPRELLVIVTHLFNFIALRFRKGDYRYLEDYLELYTLSLDKGILQIDGYLDTNYFLNTVNVTCRLKKFEWSKDFIDNYLIHIAPKHQDIAKQLANSICLYEQGLYNEVLVCLRERTFSDPMFSLRTKVLILKSLIELQSGKQTILDNCVAFEQYLRREKKLSPNTIQAYKNFIVLVKKIFLHKKKDKTTLNSFFNANPLLVQQQWLKEKIDKMNSSPLEEEESKGIKYPLYH